MIYIPKYPSFLGINITSRCNFHCTYCIVKGGDEPCDLPREDVLKIMDEAYSIGIRALDFSGGEPFLYPRFLDLLRMGVDRFNINILTNGSLIDRHTAKVLKNMGCISLRISLDGASPDIHEQFRGKGTYAPAINGLKSVLEQDLPVGVNTVLSKSNISHFKELLGLLDHLGVEVIRVLPLIAMGRGADLTNQILNKKDWWDLLKSKSSWEKEFKIRILAESPLEFLLPSALDPNFNSHPSPCVAGYLYLGVATNGDVFPCPYMMDISLGNIKESTLTDVWSTSALLKTLRDASLLKGACAECKYRDGCRGGCRGLSYYLQGDYLCPDPYCPIASQEE